MSQTKVKITLFLAGNQFGLVGACLKYNGMDEEFISLGHG